MGGFLSRLLDTSDFPPRWQCGNWSAFDGWLHILSDLGVWSAYLAIPCVLGYFVLRRKDIPFRLLFLLFGAFILACGTTHLMEAIIFWWPAYRLAGAIKLFTAIVSWATVIALVPVVPKVLAMRTPEELEREIAARIVAELGLQKANEELERRVEERTREVVQAAVALRTSEERLRLVLEAGHMGTWEWNIADNQVIWSPPMEAIHSKGLRTFSGSFEAYQQEIHPEDRERVQASFAQAAEKGKSHQLEYRVLWPDGSVHWREVRGKLHHDESSKPLRMMGVFMNIDERKQVEEERKRTEQTFRFLADASAALAALVDYESTLQKVASLAVPFFADWCAIDIFDGDGSLRRLAVSHVDPSKVRLAHDLHRRYPPDPRAAQGVWNILRTGTSELISEIPESLLAERLKDDEAQRMVRELGLKSYIGVPLKVRERTLGVITFITAESELRYDANDLAVAEDLAHRATVAIENARLFREVREADRRKEEFLATLAHELRNPLAPIKNAVQVMRLRGIVDPQLQWARDVIERQAEQLTCLVDDLLDISRISCGKVELHRQIVDLSEIMHRAVETTRPLLEERQHKLTVAPPAETVWLDADPTRLEQILANLLNNSAKYTEEGGQVWLTAQSEGSTVVVVTRDTGIGIDPEVLPHIFDMFVQADHTKDRAKGGLGIGLSLVRALAEMHGGSVIARSEGPGKGSEFSVRLPISADIRGRETHLSSAPPKRPIADLSRRILVVDDNVDAAETLATLLRLSGHEAAVVYDGRGALEAVRARGPELVILDIGMPGMDGYEVARQIRRIPGRERTLLLALTGWGQKEDRRRSKEAGFDEHLVKPVDPALLLRLLAVLKPSRA